MSTTHTAENTEITEVAYRVPGSSRGWVRRTFRTEAACRQFVERLLENEGDDVEVRWAE